MSNYGSLDIFFCFPSVVVNMYSVTETFEERLPGRCENVYQSIFSTNKFNFDMSFSSDQIIFM